MTIEEVASKMGITKGTLSAALNGNPSFNRTFMELKYFHISVVNTHHDGFNRTFMELKLSFF